MTNGMIDPPSMAELARTLARIESNIEKMDARLDTEFGRLPAQFVTREVYDLAHTELRRELMAYSDAIATKATIGNTDVANQLNRIRYFAYWSAGGVLALLCSVLGWTITHVVH